MTDAKTKAAAVPPVSSPSKDAAKKTSAGKAAKSTSHPPVAKMVNTAIIELKDRKGSSLPAIKKFMAGKFMVDPVKLAPFIKRYLKSSVTNGTIVQTKGTGASGSFKMSAGKKETGKKETKSAVKKVKKDGSEKKKTANKLKVAKSAGEKAAKAPSKIKKTKKTPATKTKAPKPKKVLTPKAKSARK